MSFAIKSADSRDAQTHTHTVVRRYTRIDSFALVYLTSKQDKTISVDCVNTVAFDSGGGGGGDVGNQCPPVTVVLVVEQSAASARVRVNAVQ